MMSIRTTTVLMVALALVLGASNASAATWVWADGEFDDADWDLVSWYPAGDSGSDATLSFTVAHGGNPDALRTSGVALGGSPDDGAMIVLLNNTWTLDPGTAGPVIEIDGGLDFVKYATGGPSRIGLAVQQDGEIFVHVLNPQAADTTWTTYYHSILTAADFAPLDPDETGQPDFSQYGAPMVFGYAVGQLAAAAAGEIYFYQYVDNLLLVMSTGPVSAVGPEARTALKVPVIRPNPFNPRTEISFEVPTEGFASLRIFDLSGRLVRTLAVRRFESGPQTVLWEGRDDSGRVSGAGVYLAVLECGKSRVSQRLTLVR